MAQYDRKNYALENKKLERSDLSKYREKTGKLLTDLLDIEMIKIDVAIENYAKCVLTEEIIHLGDKDESIREEDVGEAYQQRQQRIQSPAERRCAIKESNPSKTKGKKIMKKESAKEKKHEAKETKAYEKKEDKKESKSKKK